MVVLVFAKKVKAQDGRVFYKYLGTLQKKDGSTETVTVKFRDECGAVRPDDCPLYLLIDKAAANMSEKHYTDTSTGEQRTAKTLWVSDWVKSDQVYVDTSLDDYAD